MYIQIYRRRWTVEALHGKQYMSACASRYAVLTQSIQYAQRTAHSALVHSVQSTAHSAQRTSRKTHRCAPCAQ